MFFREKNYKVYVSDWTMLCVLLPAIKVFDTGVGEDLIRKSFLPPAWQQKIWSVTRILDRSATNDHITVCDTILLCVLVGDLRGGVSSTNVENLAVQILTGTLDIDLFIKVVFRSEWLIVLVNSGSVAILSAFTSAMKLSKTFDIAKDVPYMSEQSATIFRLLNMSSFHFTEHWNDGASAMVASRFKFLAMHPSAENAVQCWVYLRWFTMSLTSRFANQLRISRWYR